VIQQFIKYIDQNNLIVSGNKILLAVSGGIDSTVMLDLFSKTTYSYAIAHCNFMLRGTESDEDEIFIKEAAGIYNSELFTHTCNAKKYAELNKVSIQEAARELRYNWFNRVCLENNFTYVAIAHNSNDRAETFFINLFRGAGLKGLKSIPVKRDNIIRPLLFASRSQIVEYATDNNIKYREDSSNSSNYYLRNRIRHALIPALKKTSPNYENAIQKSIVNLTDSELLLQSVIDEKKKSLFLSKADNTIHILITHLKQLSPFQVWMYYLLSEFGFDRQITNAICLSIMEDYQNVGNIYISSEYELLIDREYLILRNLTQRISTTKHSTISIDQNSITHPVKLSIVRQKKNSSFVFNKSNRIAYFNLNKLSFPLTIRPWQKGDRIIPFGMNGSKLISDILIDNKVNKFEKDNTFVVLSGKKIIWLVGHRTSNEYRVKQNTKDVYVMEII